MKSPLVLLAFFVGWLTPLSGTSSRLVATAPVKDFQLPLFTAEGYRSMLIRGAEAQIVSPEEIALSNLTLTLFAADATDRVETVLVSPAATAFPAQRRVQGSQSFRFLSDELDASGEQWSYQHDEKKISIGARARVVFLRLELKDLLP